MYKNIFIFTVLFLYQILFPLPVSAIDFQVEVGDEEHVLGPLDNYLDLYFSSVSTSNGITAFTSGGTSEQTAKTVRLTGPTLETLQIKNNILSPGQAGQIDDAGAWLGNVTKLSDTHWLGWYHAEQFQPQTPDPWDTIWSMALAETLDGGVNWTKKGQIVSADTIF